MAITTNNLISRQTVGSAGAASITFSNIPQTFTDLRIVVSVRTDNTSAFGSPSLVGAFNTLTTNRTYKRVYGAGSSAGSDSNTTASFGVIENAGSGTTANSFSNIEVYIPNYASANYKSYSVDNVADNNSATVNELDLMAGLWSSTAAITSITISASAGNLVEYSTFSLYGISSNTTTQNTSVPSATGGDVITTDGTYWYHAFKYSGTFTPLKALTADCLVLSGGGGSAWESNGAAGGGGAGGLVYTSSVSFGNGNSYTATVGAGGAGATVASTSGVNGVVSSLTGTGISLTASVGGAKSNFRANGSTGGSGSGGSGDTAVTGGSGTSGQGYAGGTGLVNVGGGGGGGAGAVGSNSSSGYGGVGGAGTNTYSTWASATSTGVSGYYAGGGGGGTYGTDSPSSPVAGGTGGGGTGGGKNSGASIPAGNGTTNTGGGGGGMAGQAGWPGAVAGSGGSGIVIVRYAV